MQTTPQLTAALALAGICSQLALALLFTIVWRRLGARWAGLMAIGSVGLAGHYLNIMLGAQLDWAHTLRASALIGSLAYLAITAALLDYVEVSPRVRRRALQAYLVWVGLALVGVLSGSIDRPTASLMQATVLLAWMLLFIHAMRVEPASGHGMNVLAMLFYVGLVAVGMLGWLPDGFKRTSSVLTQLVLSMTLMTTGLLRVQRRVSQALAERDKAQADLQRSHELLEQRVAQRTAALSEHVANLESFNRSVSHDLRGPLGGIAGVATLARECLDQGDQARASAMLALIETQSERSARLVDALLQLARSGHDPLRVQALDSAGLVNEVVSDLLSRSSPAPGEQVSIQPGLPTVQADPTLLRQVFTNLIGNGLKFASGVHAPRVEIGMESGSAQDAFYVRDNGVGFASDKASELFQPFKRLHSQQFEGSGIGLSIVRRIVERHGGKVWAESAPGQGCIVRFTLGVPQT